MKTSITTKFKKLGQILTFVGLAATIIALVLLFVTITSANSRILYIILCAFGVFVSIILVLVGGVLWGFANRKTQPDFKKHKLIAMILTIIAITMFVLGIILLVVSFMKPSMLEKNVVQGIGYASIVLLIISVIICVPSAMIWCISKNRLGGKKSD